MNPGEVVVVGVEMWSSCSNPANTRGFKNQIGATFPILLNGWSAVGGLFTTSYGTYDNYIIVNKQGIVRYHAAQLYAQGNRYNLNEIRTVVDSLVAPTVSVNPGPGPRDYLLNAAPNPFSGSTTVELTNPSGAETRARVTVHDLSGRRIATLHDGEVQGTRVRFVWDGREATGAVARPGMYMLRATIGGVQLATRAVRLR